MGRLCPATDWSATPLGRFDDWPQSLRTMAASILDFAFPTMLLWGPDLVQLYNDLYIPFLGGRHPRALGISTRECWPEAVEVTAPIFERVLRGEAVSLPDQAVTIWRGGQESRSEDVTATLCYSPVRDETGSVGGILCSMFNQRAKDALRQSESTFRLLVEAVQDYGIFMLDRNGLVVSWNHGAERIKGYRADEILGSHFSAFYTEEDRARRHPEDELRIARELGRYEEAGWRVRKDGSRFWASIVISAIFDETGQLCGFAKVTRDLTERRLAEQELLEAKNAAEEANRAKSDFLAAMSHELRTPLNAISGYVDLLDLEIPGPQNKAQREALARIMVNHQHLLRLINDVLAFVKVEAGHLELEARPTAVSELLASVEPLLAPLARAKMIAMSVDECDESIRVLADPDRLRQILINLIGNAVKFTPQGGRISILCDGGATWVEIRVRDTGPGISPEKQGTVFEPFIQIDRSLTNPHEGIGLGLAISRDLARAMGGELTVESVPDQGSTFTLRLPAIDV